MDILGSVRKSVRAIGGYTPGEQPRQGVTVVKLNTNENPYPVPEVVTRAVTERLAAGLSKYPEPSSKPVREAAARAYGLTPDQVIVGNGSDDLLTIILRTFIDPGQVVATADPTYSLYETLTALQGGSYQTLPWGPDGALPVDALAATGANVVFVVRPNSPTGHLVPLSEVAALCRKAAGVVVLDEAYADFTDSNGLELLPDYPNLIITRTFSKSFSLAAARIGLAFAAAPLVAEMHKVRDSYNVDALAQAAAASALDNLDAFAPAITAIREARTRLTDDLRARGFTVPESHGNFVLATFPAGRRDGAAWLADLKAAGFLVRWFGHIDSLKDKLRISIGTPAQCADLVAAVDTLLADN